jgi:hypothetical protein
VLVIDERRLSSVGRERLEAASAFRVAGGIRFAIPPYKFYKF